MAHVIDRWLGDYSYPLYLGHIVPLVVLTSLGALESPSPRALSYAALASIILTFLLVQAIEKSIQQLRKNVRGVVLE